MSKRTDTPSHLWADFVALCQRLDHGFGKAGGRDAIWEEFSRLQSMARTLNIQPADLPEGASVSDITQAVGEWMRLAEALEDIVVQFRVASADVHRLLGALEIGRVSPAGEVVVGVDVGGRKKGFHAVALAGGTFRQTASTDPGTIVEWCLTSKASVVAVDAPCGWSTSGVSRLAERALKIGGVKVSCFSTPSRNRALAHPSGFYDWVFNGEALYQELKKHYPLFDGDHGTRPVCVETFPHAIVCALTGSVTAASSKGAARRQVLRDRGYADHQLANIDVVDAALCAVAAEQVRQGRITQFGDADEGFIVVPALEA